MATRSTVGYETETGGYVGVYCHYDGYPDHQAPILAGMHHIDVVFLVNRAIRGGGIRSLDGGELFNDDPIEAVTEWPSCPEEYAYIKRLDGRVEWVSQDEMNPVEWKD